MHHAFQVIYQQYTLVNFFMHYLIILIFSVLVDLIFSQIQIELRHTYMKRDIPLEYTKFIYFKLYVNDPR